MVAYNTLLALALAAQSAYALERRATNTSSDVSTVLANVQQLSINAAAPPATSIWLTTLKSDGSFSDVDYTAGCNGNRANWGAEVHWSHVLDMTISWTTGLNGTSYKNSSSLLTSIKSAMGYWFTNDYTNEGCSMGNGGSTCPCSTPGLWAVNWWYNVIGVPKIAGPACSLLLDQLNSTEVAGCSRILARAYNIIPQETAANLLDVSIGGIYYGVVSNNATVLSTTFNAGNTGLAISSAHADGIKVDGSFFQHSGLLASGSYGPVMFQDFLNLQSFGMGTSYQATAAEQTAFTTVLNGSQWMIYSNSTGQNLWDNSVTGRSISRPGAATDIAINITQAIQATGNWSTAAEVAEISKAILKNTDDANDGPLNGNKMFYYGDYMVHRRSNYVVTLKMTSNRTLAEECVNAENLKGFHLSDGTVYTYLTGDEYRNIFPTWDWDLIPGTTIDYRGTPNNCTPAYYGLNSFVGGVSNGQVGAAALNFENPKTKNFSWKKSWFFLDNYYIVLGSNITETRTLPVFTTLDQRKLNGQVHVNGKVATTSNIQNAKTVHHDSIGYQIIDSGVTLNLSTAVQTGDWSSIGAYSGSESFSVFNAKIAHQTTAGQAVTNGVIGMVIYPGISYSTFAKQSVPATIIQRDSNAHIVQASGSNFVGAVFWAATNATAPLFGNAGTTVQVSHPIILSTTGSTLLVADPTQTLSSVQIKITSSKSIKCPTTSSFSCSTSGSTTTVVADTPEFMAPTSIRTNITD
ncbi:hypothetical protein INT43_000048 [Umbelopsis isabellina]|uniref:Polysaccharide lyase family 8 protein n=1 Tax=Mortierella isabellina TaxID=91625 RepID=A0A8H7U711_MORIS|nr:hypothetical protein INT43_000048 [Umbelopsis isabellina]